MIRIQVSAFRWVPPAVQGLVKDLRVRWALEEARLPYEELLIGFDQQQSPEYRSLQPFGQVPAYVEDDFKLFESGAIVLHIAERSEVLLPADARERPRMHAWMFAALNSIEPHFQNLVEVELFHAGETWTVERRPMLLDLATMRLASLAKALDGREYLLDRFTAADLLMATVLRMLRHGPLVAGFPILAAYLKRCEDRPAFGRALASQMAAFDRHAPRAT